MKKGDLVRQKQTGKVGVVIGVLMGMVRVSCYPSNQCFLVGQWEVLNESW